MSANPAALDLLLNFRAYLASEGVVRVPREPDPAGAPPMWIEPRLGVPAPGEGANSVEIGPTVVLGIDEGVGITPRPYESWLRDDAIEVTIRTLVSADAHRLEEQLRDLFLDKFNWQMAALHIIESQMGRPLALLERNTQAFTHRCSFRFQRKSS